MSRRTDRGDDIRERETSEESFIESGPKERIKWREVQDPEVNRKTYNRISKKVSFYKTMFRWNRGVESSLWLPCSVIAGLNRDTIFFPQETIFSPMLFARCEGCCNLAPCLGRNAVPRLGHQKASVH